MKLVVSFLLCFLVGALATNDHKHEPFGDDVVQAIEGKLEQTLEMSKVTVTHGNLVHLQEVTILAQEEENGDEVRIGLRVHNVTMGDVKGNWEVSRPDENQLKIKIDLTQNGMSQYGKVVSTLTNLVAPGETKGKIEKRPVVIKWGEITGKLKMTVNLVDGKLSIDDLKSEVNTPKPEVNVEAEAPTKKNLEDDIARELHRKLLSAYEDLVKERYIRNQLHEVLTEVESKRHGGEQSQQQSTKK